MQAVPTTWYETQKAYINNNSMNCNVNACKKNRLNYKRQYDWRWWFYRSLDYYRSLNMLIRNLRLKGMNSIASSSFIRRISNYHTRSKRSELVNVHHTTCFYCLAITIASIELEVTILLRSVIFRVDIAQRFIRLFLLRSFYIRNASHRIASHLFVSVLFLRIQFNFVLCAHQNETKNNEWFTNSCKCFISQNLNRRILLFSVTVKSTIFFSIRIIHHYFIFQYNKK